MKRIFNIFLLLFVFVLFASCGLGQKLKDFHDPPDLRTEPLDPDARAKRNIEEGRGASILGGIGSNRTTYEFSTSNPMWRASLETLDFLPLTTVDYSGGIIITDWYSEGNNPDESIKITVRFLSNEIQSNSVKIIIHNKKCAASESCTVNEVDSNIKYELQKTIITKAALLEKQAKEIKKK